MDNALDLKTFSWKELYQAQYAFNEAFYLPLSDGDVLEVQTVLRLLPKKRMVVAGLWQAKPVVAKLFFAERQAATHTEKDAKGAILLDEHKIPTPKLYHRTTAVDRRVHVLIYERIFDAENLETIWQTQKNTDAILHAMMIELATQHVLGVLQHDMHLKNFLLTEKIIYSLDGAQVEFFPHLLSKKISMQNLSLFLAQLGVGQEVLQEKLFKYYAKARGWLLKSEDLVELFLYIKKYNVQRWQQFQKKIFRSSSSFQNFCFARNHGMYDRYYINNELSAFLQNPDAIFCAPNIEILKNGRSTTVIKAQLGAETFVIKRYNIKNVWHLLRRMFRYTRAHHAWRLAQKLKLFGVPTAAPVAFIEKKFMGLNGKSYYVTTYVNGDHAGKYFQKNWRYHEKNTVMIEQIITLLRRVAKLEITHGDLKITNILINENEQPLLIDLDGALEHASLSSLRSAWRKEIQRFLKNFHNQPTVHERFKTLLEAKA